MLSAIGGFSTVGDLYYASDDADVNAASAGAKPEKPQLYGLNNSHVFLFRIIAASN